MKNRRKSSESTPLNKRSPRNRKVRKFTDESDKSDTDGDFVQPVKKDATVSAVKEESPKPKPAAVTNIVLSPSRVKKDVDPDMPSFNHFSQEDVDKASSIKEKYEKLLADDSSLNVVEVTEEEINAAIPTSRVVTMDADVKSEEVIAGLAKFGGNPRLFTPVPDWLIPYLKGAKVKLEDVEMPSNQEIAEYLAKKQSGKRKRKAGWDIVVDWVPDEQPQTKRSKLEKQLGFDFDSSFGCSLNVSEGRRPRRSNMKYSDTSFTSEDESGKIKKGIKSIEPETKPETVKDSIPSMEVADAGNKEPDQEKSSPLSPEAPEERAELEDSAKAETEAPEVPIPASKVTSVGEESPSQGEEVEQVATMETNTETATEENVDDDSEKKVDNEADSVAVLAKIEAEITETDHELEAVLKNLKNRRKRSHSGDNKVGTTIAVDDIQLNVELFYLFQFHGWAKGDIKVAKTGYTVVATTDFPSGVDGAGASFGMSDIDLIR